MRLSASQRTADLIRQHFLFSSSAKAGDRLPRIQELSRRYGVSIPTVSKALAQLQAEGLLETARGSGIYIKSLPAIPAGDKPQRALSLGFISNAFAQPVTQRVLAGVTRTAAMQGCRVELALTNWDIQEERWHYQHMARQGLDGVIIYPTHCKSGKNHYLAEILPDFPTVAIDLARPEMRRPAVVFDNWKAGLDMTEYLIEAGHRRIAFISLGDSRSVEDRFKGYRRALAKANLEFHPEYAPDGEKALGEKNFAPLLDRLLALDPRPTAIMAPYDQFARFCIEYLENQGLVVPRDLAVTGFDNVQTEEWSHRFPTTGPDFYNLGERAVDLLLGIIDSHISVPTEIALPVPLVPFPSCAENNWNFPQKPPSAL